MATTDRVKLIGLLGGMGWTSTIEYYRLINEGINPQRGGLHAGRIALYSLDMGEVHALNERNDREGAVALTMEGVRALEAAGAEALVICTNTMHQYAQQIQAQTQLPLIHIVDETAHAVEKQSLKAVALLGTRFTMELDFFKNTLEEYGIDTLIPDAPDREFIHRTIFDELQKNQFLPETKARYLKIIASLHRRGAQGVILGCTELPLLIDASDLKLPMFNTAKIHAEAAVKFALSA